MLFKHFGFLVIDKPAGVTSHDVVARVRRFLKTRRVGHLGTLDPMATGVLPLAWGKATRLIQYVSHDPKVYAGTIRLGFSTTTYDFEGEPSSFPQEPPCREENIIEVARQFEGDQFQAPPPFSAKKVHGRPAYRLARQGFDVNLPLQPIRVDRFEVSLRKPDLVDFEIQCSPGTYIRSLAHDFGMRLRCGGHLISLRRNRSGIFHLEQAIPLEQLEVCAPAELVDKMIPPENLLRHLGGVVLSAEVIASAKKGQRFQAIPNGSVGSSTGSPVCLFDSEGHLIGLAVALTDHPNLSSALTFQPKLVLI